MTSMGYKRDTLRGLSWMSGFRVMTRILVFAKTAVLARVLTPAQFGIFGIASLVLALLEIITETGINVFLIQSGKKIDTYINTAWVVSIARGIIISLLLIACSPLIAGFFNTPEALPILLFISIVPIIRGFINPASIVYQKELLFRQEFWFRSATFLLDAIVSIILALMTQSVYSLVWGLIAGTVLEVILSFVLIKQRPQFHFRNDYFKEIFHSGKWVTMYGVLHYLTSNGDNIIVGRLMGSSALGLYQMAYKISILPISEVSDVVAKVVFPVFSKISHDRERLRKAYIKASFLTFSVALCLGLVIFLFSREIILILLGENWLAAAPVLQILSICGVIRTITGPGSALFLAVQKQNYVTYMNLVKFAGLAVTIYPLVTLYGLVGASYSALFSVLIELPVFLYFTYKIFAKKESNAL